MIKKTMLDDCRGEKIQDLLASFSTLVLQKVMAEGQGGKRSIVGRLAIAKRVTAEEHQSFLPLAIAHRASLTALLQRKRCHRAKYKAFGEILDGKERELDERFEAIVKTQEFLDANPIPDHAAARVAQIFERSWKGNAELVDIIIRGERRESRGSLLEEPFSAIWPKVRHGDSIESTYQSSHSLLADLEKRVTNQEARLKQWKEFKEAMKADTKASNRQIVQSPVLTRAISDNVNMQLQKDLVFSPRKSPRKSGWGVQKDENISFGTPTMPKLPASNPGQGIVSHMEEASKYPVTGKMRESCNGDENEENILDRDPRDLSIDEGNSSGLSEISQSTWHYGQQSGTTPLMNNSHIPTAYDKHLPSNESSTSNAYPGLNGQNSLRQDDN